MPAILVTGASTGIGEATACHLVDRGHLVFAGVRKAADGDRLQARAGDRLVPVILDVTEEKTIATAVDEVTAALGTTRFAGIVNNAGVARGGPLEYLPLDEWREQLEVNVVGQVAVTQAFLPLIRSGCGRVVFIGSIGGRVGSPLMGPYNASKFALEGIAEALRHELDPWDIAVSVVEPGAVATPIWGKGRETTTRLLDDADPEMLERYRPQMDKIQQTLVDNDEKGIDPILVAKAIEHALFAEHPRHRYLVGPDAKSAGLMSRLMPDRAKHALVRRLG